MINNDKEKKHLKAFGYGLVIIVSLISLKLYREHGLGLVHLIMGPLILLLIILTTFQLNKIKPFYKRWMVVAHFIGSVITGVLLTIIYYFVFGVAGVVLRLLKKDLLDRGLDPQARSYWIPKAKGNFQKSDYTRQF